MELEILEMTLLYAVALPAMVTVAAFSVLPARLAALASGGGWFAGLVAIQGWPQFPPVESTGWFPWLVVLLATSSAIGFLEEGNLGRRLPAVLGSAALTLVLLLQPAFQYSWTWLEAVAWIAAFLLIGFVFWLGITPRDQDDPSERSRTSLILIAATTLHAIALGVSGSVVLSQVGAVQAAVLSAVFLMTLVKRTARTSQLVPTLQSVLFVGLMAVGWYFLEVPIKCALLMAFAPWIDRLVLRRGSAARHPVLKVGLGVAVALVPMLLALHFAINASPPLDLDY